MTHVRINYASTLLFDLYRCSPAGSFAITTVLSVNLAEWNFWGVSEEARVGFLRHSEIKHGRIAMFAFVGYIAHANGFKFPWPMQLDGTPFPDELNPPLLWDKIPDGAKWQIFGFIGFLEYWGELSTSEHTHYMMPGGKPGKYPDFIVGPNGIPHPVGFNLYDPLKLWKNRSEEAKARGLLAEINNGRAAMFGILGFLSSQTVPGSVPLLNKVLPGYYGEVMIPFEPVISP
jgi:hypothetical protein